MFALSIQFQIIPSIKSIKHCRYLIIQEYKKMNFLLHLYTRLSIMLYKAMTILETGYNRQHKSRAKYNQ